MTALLEKQVGDNGNTSPAVQPKSTQIACAHVLPTVRLQDVLDNGGRLRFRCQECNQLLQWWIPQNAKGGTPHFLSVDLKGVSAASAAKSGGKGGKSMPVEDYIAQREANGAGPLPGTESLRMFARMNLGWCSDCTKLADEMDEWGPAECRKPDTFTYILRDSMKRAMKNWGNLKARAKEAGTNPVAYWWEAFGTAPVGTFDFKVVKAFAESEEAGVREVLTHLFRHAIDESERRYEERLAREAEEAAADSAAGE